MKEILWRGARAVRTGDARRVDRGSNKRSDSGCDMPNGAAGEVNGADAAEGTEKRATLDHLGQGGTDK